MPPHNLPDSAESSPAHRPAIAVREVACRSILNRGGIGDYSLNCYIGCTHACAYCYARFMQRFHPHSEPWGRFLDVKVNAVETLWRQLRRAVPGTVFVSSACDGWQPEEAHWQLTRRCCELLLDRGFTVHILTKSALVLRDLDLFAGRPARVAVTLTTLDERLARLWEPGCASVARRIDVLRQARAADISTGVMFGPLLPHCSDTERSLAAMFTAALQCDVQRIWVDTLNRRSGVWPAVAALLRAEFPQWLGDYRQILFDANRRRSYLEELRRRITRVAAHCGVSRRLTICF